MPLDKGTVIFTKTHYEKIVITSLNTKGIIQIRYYSISVDGSLSQHLFKASSSSCGGVNEVSQILQVKPGNTIISCTKVNLTQALQGARSVFFYAIVTSLKRNRSRKLSVFPPRFFAPFYAFAMQAPAGLKNYRFSVYNSSLYSRGQSW